MYLQHFGLREFPFGITPDTAFTFLAKSHQEALNTLLVVLRCGEGFVKITGEVGTGKTLLCRRLLHALAEDEAVVTAYLPNPYLDPGTLLRALGEELRLDEESFRPNQFRLLKSINLALLDHARAGRRVVLCIDEAQAMPLPTLEVLRLISNLETEKRKLLQIVLFGQPELDKKLADPAVRQLQQRIGFHHRINPLDRQEVAHYLEHRLRIAGFRGQSMFSRGAVRALYRAARGTPRLINVLAHKALLAAFGAGEAAVRRRHACLAARDTEGASSPGWW